MKYKDFEGALCTGRSWLFDSTDTFHHAEARKLCEVCPVRDACAKLLKEEQTKPLSKYGGPEGTWAGELVGTKYKPIEHGTERGYQQHRHRGDQSCSLCRAAHSLHTRDRAKKAA